MGLSPLCTRLLLHFTLSLLLPIPLCSGHAITYPVVSIENPVLDFIMSPLSAHSLPDSKDGLLCQRLWISGQSRLKLGSYANALRVMLILSVGIPKRMYVRIVVCFHKNASRGLCECDQHEWKAVQKGSWSSIMSPYVDGYVDLMIVGEVPDILTVKVKEEIHRWRFYCLALGAALFFIAPTVSSWVPFYYSSSMVIGVFLVIVILLFQFRDGSYLYYHFMMSLNSVLVNFGLSEDMHHLVSIFVLIGIMLVGAGLGYWMVRKYIISEDGTVNIGTADFVKWAIRIIAGVFFWQSTLDVPLAAVAFFSWCAICSLVNSSNRRYLVNESPWSWKAKNGTAKVNRTEFLSRSPKMGNRGALWNSPKNISPWFNSPIKGVVSPSDGLGLRTERDYYSTFHGTVKQKKFSEKEWVGSKCEWTRLALAELSSSEGFLSWMIDNANRIQVLPDGSLDETINSESDSTEEAGVESANRLNPFNYKRNYIYLFIS